MRSAILLAAALSAAGLAGVAPALHTAAAAEAAYPAGSVLPFIEDDYGRALSEAKARGKPIFIDAWAPW